jgi:hypothetical protein
VKQPTALLYLRLFVFGCCLVASSAAKEGPIGPAMPGIPSFALSPTFFQDFVRTFDALGIVKIRLDNLVEAFHHIFVFLGEGRLPEGLAALTLGDFHFP